MAARILIVEDDPDIAELVGRYLDKAGFATERVASGRDALGQLTSRPPGIERHVRRHLASYKTPRLVRFEEQLPREDSGKIFKRRLREPYWAGRERAI